MTRNVCYWKAVSAFPSRALTNLMLDWPKNICQGFNTVACLSTVQLLKIVFLIKLPLAHSFHMSSAALVVANVVTRECHSIHLVCKGVKAIRCRAET